MKLYQTISIIIYKENINSRIKCYDISQYTIHMDRRELFFICIVYITLYSYDCVIHFEHEQNRNLIVWDHCAEWRYRNYIGLRHCAEWHYRNYIGLLHRVALQKLYMVTSLRRVALQKLLLERSEFFVVSIINRA